MADSNLVDVTIRVDGKDVTLKVPPAVYEKAIERDQTAVDMIYSIYLEQSPYSSSGQYPPAVVNYISGLEGEQSSQLEDDIQDTDKFSETGSSGNDATKWTNKAVLLLLSMYADNKDKFASSSYKNKDVWKQIGDKMTEKGHMLTGECCDKKFRMLKHRHKVIKERGRDCSSWAWFDVMEELLAGDPVISPVKLISVSALEGEQPSQFEEDVHDASEFSETCTSGNESTKWTHRAILLLLSLYADNKDKIASPLYKNKDVWRQIGDKMTQKGHMFTGECCDKKFRMMKLRHRVITDSIFKSGPVRSKWKWFDVMGELLTSDPEVKPVKLLSVSAIEEEPPCQHEDNQETNEFNEAGSSGNEYNKGKFASSSYKNKDIWKQIGDKMKEKGYTYSGECCDKKFRMMKHRHKVITERKRDSSNWEWFDVMGELLAGDPAVKPVKLLSVSDLDDEKSSQLEEYFQDANEISETGTCGNEFTVWPHNAILLLLSMYADNKDKFASNLYKNKDIWKKIGDKLVEKGYPFTGDCCDKKFRQMKHRHKVIKEKGRGSSSWEWFDIMEELLIEDPVVTPVKIVATIVNEDVQDANEVIETSSYEPKEWTSKAILVLLSLYADNKDKFASSFYKNKDVWRQIGDKMKEKGYMFTGECCDDKFRAMKYRHKVIMERGNGHSNWEWFDVIGELLADDPTTTPVRLLPESKEGTVSSRPPFLFINKRATACQTTSPITLQAGQPTHPTGQTIRTSFQSTSQSPSQNSSPEPTIEEVEAVICRKRKRRDSEDPPEWFQAFAAEQSRRFDKLQETTNRILAVAEERNCILRLLLNKYS